eukprot:SAG31_NODE_8009_length_1542_cov_2.248094_1_plen_215_part_00
MSLRSEIRESLRDELANQNNRFNNVMLCDTVCLGCAFGMVIEGEPPSNAHISMLAYIASLGLSICLFTISLWSSIIVVRRLNEHTATVLEQKLFANDVEQQKRWVRQVSNREPTGMDVLQLMSLAWHDWYPGDRNIQAIILLTSHGQLIILRSFVRMESNCEPLSSRAVIMMSSGVVSMFVCAGLMIQSKFYAVRPFNPLCSQHLRSSQTPPKE